MITTFSSRVLELIPLLMGETVRAEYNGIRSCVELVVHAVYTVQLWLIGFHVSEKWRYASLDTIASWSLGESGKIPFFVGFWTAASLPVAYLIAYWVFRSPLLRQTWHASRLGFYAGRAGIFGVFFMPIANYVFQIMLCTRAPGNTVVAGTRVRRFVLVADPSVECWSTLHASAFAYGLVAIVGLVFQAFTESRAFDALSHESSNPLRTARHIKLMRTKITLLLTLLVAVKVFAYDSPRVQLALYFAAAILAIVYLSVRIPYVASVHIASFPDDPDPQELEQAAQDAAHEVPSVVNDVMVGIFTCWLWTLIIATVNLQSSYARSTPYFMLLGVPGTLALGFYASWARRNRHKLSLPSKRDLPDPHTRGAFWRHPQHPHIVSIVSSSPEAKTVRILSDHGAAHLIATLRTPPGALFAPHPPSRSVNASSAASAPLLAPAPPPPSPDASPAALAPSLFLGPVRSLSVLGRNPYFAPEHGWRAAAGVSDAGIAALAALLGSGSPLAYLQLSGFAISPAGVEALAAALATNTSLLTLDLSNNGLDSPDLVALLGPIAAHPRLIRVNLAQGLPASALSPDLVDLVASLQRPAIRL